MKRLFYILLLIGILASCKKTIHQQVADQIKLNVNATSQKDSCIIDINDFIDLEWDKMYVFKSWTMPEDISSAIGFKYEGQFVKDDARRIIFVKDKKIIFEQTYSLDIDDIFDFDYWNSSLPYFYCETKSSRIIVKKLKSTNSDYNLDYYRLHPIN